MPVELDLIVQNPKLARKAYDHIKVYRAPNATATFAEITGPTSRVPLADKISYEFLDGNGRDTDFYRWTYWNHRTGAESTPSEAVQGQVDPALEVVSVRELKENYLFGVNLVDDDGNEMPNSLFRWYIQAAMARIEHELDLRLRPFAVTAERHDFFAEEFRKFQYIVTHEYPILRMPNAPDPVVRLQFPSNPTFNRTYDAAWIQVDDQAGVIEVVPGAGSLALPYFGAGGLLMPSIYGGMARYVPNVLTVDYTAGFPRGHVPQDLRHLVAMVASFGPLDLAGDLLGGAGVASYSIALDGLSQSVNTTSSPQYAGYGARLNLYAKEVKTLIPILRNHFKGIRAFAA